MNPLYRFSKRTACKEEEILMEETVSTIDQYKKPTKAFWKQHGSKIAAFLFWAAVFGLYIGYTRRNDLTLGSSVRVIGLWLTGTVYGPLLYIALYIIRPVIFFPSTILTALGGFLFGTAGILYTILGGNGSAMAAYGIGRYFGQGVLEEGNETNIVQRYAARMRDNSFETVLIMRLIFLPFDLVNYAAGFLKINWRPFLLATIIGSIPGTISFVLLGTSFGTLDELISGELSLNPPALILSVVIIGSSIALSRIFKRRETT